MSTGTLHVMDRSGDTETNWDSDNQAEVDAARSQFDELTGKGYVAYTVTHRPDGDDHKGKIMRKFDPNAESIILSPPMAGG